MQEVSSSIQEYCTSMVGVGLVADILPDLPLPTHRPTSLESVILGKDDVKPETERNLANVDSLLCTQIDRALKLVDTSFLNLKVAPPKQEYRPEITSPALIKALLKNGFPQPRVSLKKLDLNQYSSPVNSSGLLSPLSCSAHSPLDTPQNADTPSRSNKSLSTSHRRLHGGRGDKIRGEPTLGKTKRGKMVVSINRDLYESSRKRKNSTSHKHRRLSSSGSDSEFKLPVRISRKKLLKRGNATFPSSPVPQQYPIENREEFSLAPGVHDQPISESGGEWVKKKKKKKKKHHFQMDRVHKAHVERYSNLLDTIIDQTDHDSLLSRQVISQLLSETAQLKQLRVLHQVSANLLVRIISVMDIHVLDTASLLINDPPDETDSKLWREISRDRILRSLDAGLVTLHIITAPYVPKQVHIEESIDQLISHTKYHLENNIYPEFDPVYRAESKETGVNAKQKRRYTSAVGKDVVILYNRLVEVMDTLALLVEKQSLTDITVLKLSTIGVLPFFVENISNLQLSSLKLVRTIFSRYEKHRDLIFEDIFASLARLPTTKKNLRSFRLSSGQSIQMLTALILQLLQCTVIQFYESESNKDTLHTDKDKTKVDIDVAVINSYDLSLRTGSNFLSTFMRKCCSCKDEDDFRPLFDNFVQDLLATLNLPEWPASEVLLTLMGVLLVQTFSSRSNEQQLRLISLEHLGLIAARLRKDAVTSAQESHEQLVDILSEILQKKMDSDSPLPSPDDLKQTDAFSENARHLQKALIAYLSHRSLADPSYAFARNFYLGQWLRDSHVELERGLQQCHSPSHTPGNMGLSDDEDNTIMGKVAPSVELVHQAEQNKDFLKSLAKPMSSTIMNPLASVLDDKNAIFVTQYLSSARALSKSFDMYLQKLLMVLNESAVHVRTRAMKTLSTIVSADPTILSRNEVQKAVYYRFSDTSTLMREAAVDLIGRFVLVRPELTATYYEMLLERIRDTGVSVRRRVIKILKDICINQPKFDKVSDICINIIRRINDEEGIKQVVTGVFQHLWFAKPSNDVKQQVLQRVLNITEVVATSTNEQECFELLLAELLKGGDDSTQTSSVLEMCQLMVNCLVERVLYLDETSDERKSSKELVNCITTLYLFSKSRPKFLIHHAKTLLPYLSSKCSSQEESLSVYYVARVLESVVPLIERPTKSFLTSLEEDLIKLIMKQGPMIVQSCVACLAQVVNKVTKDHRLVVECYDKFFVYLDTFHSRYKQDPVNPKLATVKPSVLRSTFTLGLFCKYFDIDKIIPEAKGLKMSWRVHTLLLSICDHNDDEIKIKSLVGFGFLCINYPELMLETKVKDLYFKYLAKDAPLKLKLQVMKNLQTYLVEVEATLKQADANRQKEGGEESLMELGDRHSSVSSNIAQLYLPIILETFYTTEFKIRLCVIQSVLLILRQGLVHPGQSVSHLIAMSTDSEQEVQVKADVQLSEYSGRFGGFMQTHLVLGLKRAYEFQKMTADVVTRGCSNPPSGGSSSLLSHLYTLVRSSKPQRRAFLKAVLKPFEDFEHTPLGMLLFLADTLSSSPYSIIEEPLFVIHHIDMTLSVTGASVLQSLREALGKSGAAAADEEEDDVETLSQETKSFNLVQLNECCVSALGCVLLLVLKQYLKQSYNLSDKKCQEYSPSSTNKMWDKAVSRRLSIYNPKEVIDELERQSSGIRKQRAKEDCIKLYIHFKRLMNRLDQFDGDNDNEDEDDVFDNSQLDTGQLLQPPVTERHVKSQPGSRSRTPQPRTPQSKQRNHSRGSSVSSNNSNSSKGKKKTKGNSAMKTPKKRRYNVLSDSSDDSDFAM